MARSRGGSMRGRAAARGAVRSAQTAKASRGNAAAGRASAEKARAAAGLSAKPEARRQYEADEALNNAALIAEGNSPEFINQISSWYQMMAKQPIEVQNKMMKQLEERANSQVDTGFDNEANYLNTLKGITQGAYDDQLSLFKKQEAEGVANNLGEASRNTGSQLQGAYAGLAANNSFDSGQMGSIASRAIEDYMRRQTAIQTESENAIKGQQQDTDSASSLLGLNTLEKLRGVSEQRLAARKMQLGDEVSLAARTFVRGQESSANQISNPSPPKKPKRSPIPSGIPSMDYGGYRKAGYSGAAASKQLASDRRATRAAKTPIRNF